MMLGYVLCLSGIYWLLNIIQWVIATSRPWGSTRTSRTRSNSQKTTPPPPKNTTSTNDSRSTTRTRKKRRRDTWITNSTMRRKNRRTAGWEITSKKRPQKTQIKSQRLTPVQKSWTMKREVNITLCRAVRRTVQGEEEKGDRAFHGASWRQERRPNQPPLSTEGLQTQRKLNNASLGHRRPHVHPRLQDGQGGRTGSGRPQQERILWTHQKRGIQDDHNLSPRPQEKVSR